MYGAGDVRFEDVPECVGLEVAVVTALEIVWPGGAIGRVGVPAFWKNASVGGGSAPVRAYIEDPPPDVLEGRIEPGQGFDRLTDLDGVPDGYRVMNERESIKVMVQP